MMVTRINIVESLRMIAVCVQAFYAGKSYYVGLIRNDYFIYRAYFISKCFFITANILDLVVKGMENFSTSLIPTNGDGVGIEMFLECIWACYDFYLLLVIYSFCGKVKKGYYGETGRTPMFPDPIGLDNDYFDKNKAIIIETEGYKIKNSMVQDIEVGIPVGGAPKNKEKNKEKQVGKRKKYFGIYPLPLLKSQIRAFIS